MKSTRTGAETRRRATQWTDEVDQRQCKDHKPDPRSTFYMAMHEVLANQVVSQGKIWRCESK